MADRLGIRALTMQQPFAAAMAHGQGLYSRRGKATKFAEGGEWVAVHCGQNEEHLKNAALMKAVRKHWPACPSDAELRSQMRSIVGVAHFVDGDCDAAGAARSDVFLGNYDCSKPVAWRADAARAAPRPLPYPKGNLQIWHVGASGFADASDGKGLLALAGEGKGVKRERAEEPPAGKATKAKKEPTTATVKKEEVKQEPGRPR